MLLTLRYLAKAIGLVKVKAQAPGVISYILFICDSFLSPQEGSFIDKINEIENPKENLMSTHTK